MKKANNKKTLILTLLLWVIVQNTNAQVISTIAGTGISGNTGDGGLATAATMTNPNTVAIDGSGNVYIAVYNDYVVRKINTSGVISTVAGNGVRGFSGDGGLATSAQLAEVEGVAIDNAGNIYIADPSNHRVRVVNSSGIISTFAGNGIGGFSGDGGLATAARIQFPSSVSVAGGNVVPCADSGIRHT